MIDRKKGKKIKKEGKKQKEKKNVNFLPINHSLLVYSFHCFGMEREKEREEREKKKEREKERKKEK